METTAIRMLEEMGANGHPALDSMMYDGWQLRFSEGYTGRANSISVLYPSMLAPEEKISRCEQYYRARNLPCMFKLTEADAGLRKLLEARGYQAVKPTCVMTAELRDAEMPEGNVVFSDTPSEEWLSAFFPFEEITDPASQAVFRRMLERLHVRTRFASVKRDGRTAACAASAMERGYALLQYVVVDPEHRGKGLGRTICRALLAEAAGNGAEHAYLQVMLNNLPALRLYESLGFRKAYDYCYVKPTGAGTDPVTDAYILR